jgi:hypothetical protein
MNIGNRGALAAATSQPPWIGICQGALVALTVIDLASPSSWAVAAMAAAALLFVAAQWHSIAVSLRRTCTFLMLLTAALLPFVPDVYGTLGKGLRIGGLIGSLLLSVATLSRAAQRVALLRRVMNSVLEVPALRRFGTVTVASQVFGGFLGLAGITMMMEAASGVEFEGDEQRAACFVAIARGYAAANLWSPMFSNLSILLAVESGLAWVRVFPAALGLAGMSLVLTLLLGRIAAGRKARDRRPDQRGASGWDLLHAARGVVAAMCAFLVVVLCMSHWLQQPVAAIVIVLAPVCAWLLALRGGVAGQTPGAAAQQVLNDFRSFKSMAPEVMLFFASGCAGTVIAGALPSAWTAPIAALLMPHPVLACLLLSGGVVLLSCTSVHPMLSGIVVALAFPSASLGLSPTVHVLAVLSGLGMAVIMTPFSVISLMASRASGMSMVDVSFRANLGFAIVNLLFVALILGGASSLLLR